MLDGVLRLTSSETIGVLALMMAVNPDWSVLLDCIPSTSRTSMFQFAEMYRYGSRVSLQGGLGIEWSRQLHHTMLIR